VTLAHAPLPEERVWNRITAARVKRRKNHHEVWKVAAVAKHNRNDSRERRGGLGMRTFLLMKTESLRLVPPMRMMRVRKVLWSQCSG
jgi:hypothetical protein